LKAGRTHIRPLRAAVKAIGAHHFVLGTDLGQTGNPSPADRLQLFVTNLMKAGVTMSQKSRAGEFHDASTADSFL
jgi:hypothetical protein